MGGGTGASTLLKELRTITPDITAIVTTFDSGGSSGLLRAKHAIPAPGDIRRCLAALGSNEEQSALFNKRLKNGHAVGNLVLCGLTRQLGSFDLAIKEAERRLGVTGQVLPVTSRASAALVMHHGGEKIIGEYEIGTFPVTDPKAHVSVEPDVELHPAAALAIERADMIVIAPGSLLTSLEAVLAPRGVKQALQSSKGLLVNVANLTPEKPHTPDQWHIADHVQALEQYTGRPFDVVIYNNDSQHLPGNALNFEPSRFQEIDAFAIGAPIVRNEGVAIHNAHAVTEQLGNLLTHRLETQFSFAS